MNKSTREPILTFLIGLPASGKTTWAKSYIDSHPDTVRVSRDDLRTMRHPYWIPDQERVINDWEIALTATALGHGKDVILDATNLHPERRDAFTNRVDEYIFMKFIDDSLMTVDNKAPKYFTVEETSFLDVSIDECIKRDSERKVGKVGEEVIKNMAQKAGIHYPQTQRYTAGLPYCIICDIDGTLAINDHGRNFYAEDESLLRDKLDVPTNEILEMFKQNGSGITIILLSGRKRGAREMTAKWLKNSGVRYDALIMREENDNRKDSIVKKDLYLRYVQPSYNTLFVLDDRDQVVDMWRKELGLKCYQVNYGDF